MKYIGLIDDQRLLQLQEKQTYDSYLMSLEQPNFEYQPSFHLKKQPFQHSNSLNAGGYQQF